MSVTVAGAPCNLGVAADPQAAPTADVLLDATDAAQARTRNRPAEAGW